MCAFTTTFSRERRVRVIIRAQRGLQKDAKVMSVYEIRWRSEMTVGGVLDPQT